jgi:prophage regulatory protein
VATDIPWRPASSRERYQLQETFLRLNDVTKMTGLARSTVYAHGRSGRFPRPIRAGGTVAAWLGTEVKAWMDEQIRISRGGKAPLPLDAVN